MSPPSVKKTQHQFQVVLRQLKGKLRQLQSRRETMDTRAFVVVEEVASLSPVNGSGLGGLDEQPKLYHGEVGSLVATATDILIKALQIKLDYVSDILDSLSLLVSENPRQATPTELLFVRYEEWLESNQQLFEFNSQLYDLERAKFELRQKQKRDKGRESEAETVVASKLVHSSISQAQALLTRLQHRSHSSQTTHAYIHQLLNPRGGKMTFEAQKVQEYVAECFEYADADPTQVKGIHSERYQEFMDVLCNYIVEKQRNWQREDTPFELVYSAVERCVMPRLKTLVLSRVAQHERDAVTASKCQVFSGVTQHQLRVRPQLQSDEPVPFIEAITQLRASYFSTTPTDKMYSVVAAAKALYDRLGDIGESSIDGDAFLDLWIYVIIKANINSLATNLAFMIEYGNPQLACGETGYYLTTVEAAVQFITSLTPEALQTPCRQMEFVVCERAHFLSLCSTPGSVLEMVAEETELHGYRVAVIREWALNRARLFRTALVPASYQDTAKVSVIRVKPDSSNAAMAQYMVKQLQCEDMKNGGLYAESLPLGTALFVDMKKIDHTGVILLPTGDYDAHKSDLNYILHLERLGSLLTDTSTSESYLYTSSSMARQEVDIPISPPYYSSTRGSISHGAADLHTLPHGRGAKMKNETPTSPLWSPYVLSQNVSPTRVGEDGLVGEVSFTTEQVTGAGVSVSEHRRLKQSSVGYSADSTTPHSSKMTHSLSAHPGHSVRSDPSQRIIASDNMHERRPVTVTVEAEVHEDFVPPATETSAAVEQTDSDTQALDIGNDADVSVEDGNSNGNSDMNKGSQDWVELKDSNVCGLLLAPEHRRRLEEVFITNHLHGIHPKSIADAARTITLQAQMFLQRLNYLSVSYKITGEYDDITLNAVKTFQRAHNHHEALFSVTLLENGHLSPTTYQFLRQAYITIYASMVRIGLDIYLGNNFDPMSTALSDMCVFRECVSQFQMSQSLKECQTGAMCASTIHRMKQLLHTQEIMQQGQT